MSSPKEEKTLEELREHIEGAEADDGNDEVRKSYAISISSLLSGR